MKFRLKQIGASFLFAMGIADACAGPANRWDVREWAQMFQIQRTAIDRGDRNDLRQAPSDERRRDGGRMDRNGFPGQQGNMQGNGNDGGYRSGRMSPEERRALRRQIDEAGHDIYRPKR